MIRSDIVFRAEHKVLGGIVRQILVTVVYKAHFRTKIFLKCLWCSVGKRISEVEQDCYVSNMVPYTSKERNLLLFPDQDALSQSGR